METLYRSIDRFNDRLGRAVSWFVLAMVIIQFTLVMMRYVFSAGSFMGLSTLWWQESIVYLHGALIMLAAAYTLLHDGHVRVDIFYRVASTRAQDWTDLLGSVLFLLPVCYLIVWSAMPGVLLSWASLEGSGETSGIPLRFLLRSTVPLFGVLVGLQALSIAIKAAMRLAGTGTADPFMRDNAE
jgi:TRAP-type mannitol/chloroaromatic compound transport system permease small subunit